METTSIEALTKRLQVHAQGTEGADNHKNLADYVWMLEHQGVAASPDEVWAELREDFEDLNTLLNAGSDFSLGRPLAYAINEMLNHCLDIAVSQRCDEWVRNQMLQMAWRIGTAWDAVLAGDIEKIGEHVELEKTAREI